MNPCIVTKIFFRSLAYCAKWKFRITFMIRNFRHSFRNWKKKNLFSSNFNSNRNNVFYFRFCSGSKTIFLTMCLIDALYPRKMLNCCTKHLAVLLSVTFNLWYVKIIDTEIGYKKSTLSPVLKLAYLCSKIRKRYNRKD